MTDSVNTRELILSILLDVTKEQEYSHIAIKNVLDKYQYLEKQERSFITRVTEGTLENMILIDYIINQFSKVKVNKMKPVIRNIIRSAVYQLKFMDSVPDSAACNEAVKLAQKKGFHNLKGFVNGVLRNISRNLDTVTYPDPKTDYVKSLSVRYSMPEWILNQWLEVYDREQVEKMVESYLTTGPTSIRTNLTKTTPQELRSSLEQECITVTENPTLSYAMYIAGYDSIAAIGSFQRGEFYVQDMSSMMVAEMADPKQGDTVIDVCAAPGGKSIHMAEKLQGTGNVDARDVTDYKVELMRENAERCGMDNMSVKVWDARVLDESCIASADIVVADLPCSGLGVLSKKTDIKYRMTRKGEEDLAALQREILGCVYQYVKPEGTLLYSTCTIDRMENEDNVEWFLKERPEFSLVEMRQILPGEEGNDGFFIAKMKRSGK